MSSSNLQNRRILLGVTGGIAAYKSAELVRGFKAADADLQIVMTPGATRFITPLTLQALGGGRVRCDLWDAQAEAAMGHIELARWAEFVLVAPASADFLARIRLGRADDLLTTLCLASEAPVAVAPAMNRVMWQHPATQENVSILLQRGVAVWGPDVGEQACGETGPGRMLAPQTLLQRVDEWFARGSLTGVEVMITAGPTREAIDPVRFLSNRSSGKMGYALAQAAQRAGAGVTLVSGPVALPPPDGVAVIPVESAREMFDAVMANIAGKDIFIGAAAVADYSPVIQEGRKIKKQAATLSLQLTRTPDILAAVAALDEPPFTVGFAAETDGVSSYAKAKLESKRVDMIAANQVGEGIGFEVDVNALQVFWQGGEQSLETAPKQALAEKLMDLIVERYAKKNTTEDIG